jgi:DNA repair protein RecN (Recombination protein N)
LLKKLSIRNYALIKQLEMEPSGGLNVITGETGAGKSIMLGALGLLMGNRADTKVLWDEVDKCVTEGEFDISGYRLQSLFKKEDLDYDDTTVIRREISSNGKSRAFINDTPVTLELLKRISGRLMDIHSQHETLELGSRSFQLQLVDAFSGNEKLKNGYSLAWAEFTEVQLKYETLLAESKLLKEEFDFIQFQLEELKKANLEANEQANLETELKIQEHAEEIKKRFHTVAEILGQSDSSVTSALAEVRSQINGVASFSPSYQKLFERVESIRIDLEDVAAEVEREKDNIEFDPERLEEVKGRLSHLYQLLQKHRLQNVSELLQLQENLQEKASKTIHLDEHLTDLKQKCETARAAMNEKADALTRSRAKVFAPLCAQIKNLLKQLGIPDAQLTVEHEKGAPGPTGADSIELMFSANKGISPRPLAQVASGGEFARLMFSIKHVMAEKTAMPTLVLDEIDTGVSGEIALQLGKLMKDMADRHQVIAISHLPQIAAKGDTHYFVYKDNSQKKTTSHIKKLDENDRVEEIAKMIGGTKPSKLALENARELMTQDGR